MIAERIPLAREGVPFFGITAFLAVVAAWCGTPILALLFVIATLFFLFFFRDPERSFTTQQGAVISPADGRIVHVGPVVGDGSTTGEWFKVSIFMSPFDVHVNRIPLDCTVMGVEYIPGRYVSADKELASRENERNLLFLELDNGGKMVLTQVAGFLARRIVCRARPGDRLKQGERFGLIRLGSRIDLLLPMEFSPWVRMGDRVRAGQTTLGVVP